MFGGINSCNHVTVKPISTQFKSGYATILVNNLNSGTSLNSNCEPDFSKPLVNNVHELLLKNKEMVERDTQNKIQESIKSNPLELVISDSQALADFNPDELIIFEPEELFSFDPDDPTFFDPQQLASFSPDEMIVFEPEVPNMDFSITEDEAILRLCGTVCRKLVEKTNCSRCIDYFETPSDFDQILYKNPSSAFIKSFKILYYFSAQIIPDLCSEKSLKSKIVEQLVKAKFDEIGCSEHKNEVTIKMKDLAANSAIKDFNNNINNLLSGKITSLPRGSNDMFKLALDFRNKGKHKGKYEPNNKSILKGKQKTKLSDKFTF